MDSSLNHPDYASGKWRALSVPDQMANIGSEVSRALKNKERGKISRMNGAIDRALELYDLSIKNAKNPAEQKEIGRAREEFCDYFFNDNSFGTDPAKMMAYYDQFAYLVRQ